jgi:protocatechuate 3,4-dioxygenase beta subunit
MPAPSFVPLVVIALLALTTASCVGPSAAPATREGDLASIVRPTEARKRGDETAQSLAGTVVDEAGAPLAGVRVIVEAPVPLRHGEPNPATQTDDRGRFAFDALPIAGFVLCAERAGFARARLHAETGDDAIAFRLRAARELAGRVVDADGKAVAGATVRFVRPSDPWSSKTTQTDASGSFLITDVDDLPGTIEVEVDHYAGQHAERRVLRERDVVAGGPAREFRFRAGLSIAGIVVDEKGRPARSVAVQALASPISDDAECWGARTTGDDGRFEIPDLPPGRYALRFWRWGSTGSGPPRELVGGDNVEAGRTDVRLRLVLSIESR